MREQNHKLPNYNIWSIFLNAQETKLMSTLCAQTCGTHWYTIIQILSSRDNIVMTTQDVSTLLISVFVSEIFLILFKSGFIIIL